MYLPKKWDLSILSTFEHAWLVLRLSILKCSTPVCSWHWVPFEAFISAWSWYWVLRASPPTHCTACFGWRSIKICLTCATVWLWLAQYARGWRNPKHSLTTVLDWLGILIGPSDLLYVSSDFYCLMFMLMGGAWICSKMIFDWCDAAVCKCGVGIWFL
jgi:hypothetical protein